MMNSRHFDMQCEMFLVMHSIIDVSFNMLEVAPGRKFRGCRIKIHYEGPDSGKRHKV